MVDNDLLRHIADTVGECREDIGIVKTDLSSAKEDVRYLRKLLVEGNGNPSVITRLALLEQDSKGKQSLISGWFRICLVIMGMLPGAIALLWTVMTYLSKS